MDPPLQEGRAKERTHQERYSGFLTSGGDDNRTPLPSPHAHAPAPPKGACDQTRPSRKGGFDRTPLGSVFFQEITLPRGVQKNPPLLEGRVGLHASQEPT
ncbi:hypothetical protein PGTUg99_022815 [Puccinia graminis f. sp. tritici]|uniref:Uncharacterized protein n=1 Tax=Puccinia graminis f. sp. tritici TaxID=56615 RepID=A0A5B0LT23_PUCGR|nr:hypothetical protein PGTUg99_022815 [Puccinia graminis f. sp. tritici]